MVNVATYNVYVSYVDGQFQVSGDADSANGNTIMVSQPAAVISVTVPGLAFQSPPVTLSAGDPPPAGSGLMWGEVPDGGAGVPYPTLMLHDVNTAPGSSPFTLNLIGADAQNLSLQLTVQNV